MSIENHESTKENFAALSKYFDIVDIEKFELLLSQIIDEDQDTDSLDPEKLNKLKSIQAEAEALEARYKKQSRHAHINMPASVEAEWGRLLEDVTPLHQQWSALYIEEADEQ